MEIQEFVLFLKCLKQKIKYIQFSFSNDKVVFGGTDDKQTIFMFVQTIPTKFKSQLAFFDVMIPVKNILNIFNIYRSTKSDDYTNDTVNITIECDNFNYTMTCLENVKNQETTYTVKSRISDKINNTLKKINIHQQKLPNFLRKTKCPTKIVSKILTNMSDDSEKIKLSCTKSSLIIENEMNCSYEIYDETIFSNVDIDSYITVDLTTLCNILDTATATKYIDMYFTGENLLALSNQHDEYLFTFYIKNVV